MNQSQALQILTDLPKALASIDDVRTMAHRMKAAQTVKQWAKQIQDTTLAVKAVEVNLLAKRLIGEFLIKAAQEGTRTLGRPRKGSKVGAPTDPSLLDLKTLGLNKDISRECQKWARKEEDDFYKFVKQESELIAAQALRDKPKLRILRNQKKLLRVGARKAREELQGKKIRAIAGPTRFGVIVANLPWGRTQWSAPEEDKRINKVEELDAKWTKWAKDIDAVAAPNCTLGMWCTEPWRGLEMLRAWGFEPRGMFYWVKDFAPDKGERLGKVKMFRSGDTITCTGPAGKGYWNRHRVEVLLIGGRGHPVAPSEVDRTEQVWFARRPKNGKPGEKPDVAMDWFDLQFPNQPKLEIYAFNYRKGWAQEGPDLPDGPRGINDTANEPLRFRDMDGPVDDETPFGDAAE